jgi:CubicO group peptidase (beta-lactamase class C family)
MTGTPYTEFVTQRIFTPLGMARSTFSFKQAQEYGHVAEGFIQAGQTGHDYGMTMKVSGGPENASGTALSGCGGIFSCIEDMVRCRCV